MKGKKGKEKKENDGKSKHFVCLKMLRFHRVRRSDIPNMDLLLPPTKDLIVFFS